MGLTAVLTLGEAVGPCTGGVWLVDGLADFAVGFAFFTGLGAGFLTALFFLAALPTIFLAVDFNFAGADFLFTDILFTGFFFATFAGFFAAFFAFFFVAMIHPPSRI
ncbi:MAG: hypothetical protein ACKVQK_29225 [Burkholderiales bacterium]